MEYRERLEGAIERSKKWNLKCPGLALMEGYLSDSIEVENRPSPDAAGIAEFSRNLGVSPRERTGSCAGAHLLALSQLYEDGVTIPPVVTVGNVLVDGEAR